MRKFFKLISFIIMISLFGLVVFFCWKIYNEVINGGPVKTISIKNEIISVVDPTTEQNKENDNQNSIVETISDFFTTEDIKSETYSQQASVGKHYYEQLSETQKMIFNGLQENKENLQTGTYKIEYGNAFSDILKQDNGSEVLGNDFQTAIEAFSHDNADLFYLDVSKMYLNMETKKRAFSTKYNVFIAPAEGENYFSDEFKTEASVKNALQKIESVKNKVLAKMTGDKYKDIKTIHDYLVDSISYDEYYQGNHKYSIYGALIDKKCVCEGYARAFKYLADSAGIECIIMQGTATNLEGTTERHAWNAVYISNKWYMIDVTWDDPILIGNGIIRFGTHYKYFLKGTKTFSKDHYPEKQFTEGGKVFNYPNLSKDDY